MSNDILAVIQDNVAGFSKGQKLIANYILNYYDKAAFMTASKLGKTVNVSESTVVRFAAELGFDGYPSMQKALQEMIRNKLTSIQRIEVTNDRIGNQDILSTVMQSDVEKIRMTMEETDRTSFSNAVDAICNARKIYILGVRSASMLAKCLYRHVLSPLFQADDHGYGIRKEPGGYRHCHYGQQDFSPDSPGPRGPDRKERHGVLRRLSGCAFESGECPHCGSEPEEGQ